MDVETVERVEAELDSFIERRVRERKEADRIEEAWAESERRHQEERRRQTAQEWLEFHDRQLRCHKTTLGELLAYHQRERDRYAFLLNGTLEAS